MTLGSKFEDIESKIDQLLENIRSEPVQYPYRDSKILNLDVKHKRAMRNLEHCVMSAKEFMTYASTSVSLGSTISDFESDGRTTEGERMIVEDWFSSPEYLPQGSSGRSFSSPGHVDEVRFDDNDPHLDFQVIQNWRQAAASKLKSALYAEADVLLDRVRKKSNEIYGAEHYWRDETVAMLLTVWWQQGKWDDLEKHLGQVFAEQTLSERSKEAAETKHMLALVSLAKWDLDNAQYHCQQAVNVLRIVNDN